MACATRKVENGLFLQQFIISLNHSSTSSFLSKSTTDMEIKKVSRSQYQGLIQAYFRTLPAKIKQFKIQSFSLLQSTVFCPPHPDIQCEHSLYTKVKMTQYLDSEVNARIHSDANYHQQRSVYKTFSQVLIFLQPVQTVAYPS